MSERKCTVFHYWQEDGLYYADEDASENDYIGTGETAHDAIIDYIEHIK